MPDPSPAAEAEPSTPAPESIDGLFKVLLGRHSRDIVEWLVGGPVLSVSALETSHPLVQRRAIDKLYEVERVDGPSVIFHVEVQLEGRPNMPFRMAEYSGALLRAFADAIERGVLPASVVIYLDRRCFVEDPGRFQIVGAFDYRFGVEYKVVKLWEISPEPILIARSPGLLPLVPLMAGNPQELVVRSAETIRNAPEGAIASEDKGLLLDALALLSRRVLMKTEIEDLLNSQPGLAQLSPFYSLGERKGKAEGKASALHQSIRRILEGRFGALPPDLRSRIDALDALETLETLVVTAALACDLAAFRAAIAAHPGPISPWPADGRSGSP